ncbi:MAG TPA: rod shape-determining protein MreD [Syntrophomonadaceae bacterium]|nr:rod shape-determining protein MreD [Syntrophomonadaceae bacterium]
MRYLVLILLPFLSIFLQSTLFGFYPIKGALPDLILIFVVFLALLNKPRNAFFYGFLCGLLEDLYIGSFIGINALAKGATAYLISRLGRNVFKDNILIGIITVMFGTIINGVFLVLLSLISYNVFHLDINILPNMLYQSIYNILLATPIYAWYYHSTKDGVLRPYGGR